MRAKSDPIASPTLGAPATTSEHHPCHHHSGAGSIPPGMVVLGRYLLQRPLGTGGFATVWMARDERLDREVAVKMLPRELVLGGRFEREARAAARLSHPAVVTLYEAAVDDEGAYLVSELVRGATLAQLLEAGRLSDRDIVTIGVTLCDALGHAHAQGVVHRDVKPSNVLVPERPCSAAEVAKLTDFGVARLIGGNTLTRTGDVVGTAAYMAPEQAMGGEADAAADLYSLALVLYEALTGLNPIAGTTAARRARRLGAHLPPLRRHRRDLPRDLTEAIDLALQPRPRERGTVQELRVGLVEASHEVQDIPGTVEPPWPARPRMSAEERGAPAALPGSQEPAPHQFPQGFRWPHRALAGGCAALTAAWLLGTVFASPPLAPAGAALLTFLAVAALPRVGWIALIVAVAAGLSAQGRPGTALIIALGGVIPIALLPRAPSRWPLAVIAAALGAASLAGIWPALAGRERRVWRRAALGATGWVATVLVGLILGHGVYAALPSGIAARPVWMESIDQTLSRVVLPLWASGILVPAVAWGLAAALLPWILRGPLAVRVVLSTMWSAGLAATTATLVHAVRPAAALSSREVVLGAVGSAAVALIPTILARCRAPFASADTAAGLA